MNRAASDPFWEMFALYGPAAIDQPQLCETLLRLQGAKHQQAVDLLVIALHERVPQELLNTPANQLGEVGQRLVQRLVDSYHIEEEKAGWAVKAWLWALIRAGRITATTRLSFRRPTTYLQVIFFTRIDLLLASRIRNPAMLFLVCVGIVVTAIAVGLGLIVGLVLQDVKFFLFLTAGLLASALLLVLVVAIVWGHHWLLRRASVEWIIAGGLIGTGVGWIAQQNRLGNLGGHWLHVGALLGAIVSVSARLMAQRSVRLEHATAPIMESDRPPPMN